jgi:signal transduction histidine kinase
MDALLDLAPLDLPNHRVRRYLGDDLCLPLSTFAPVDQELIRALYAFLQELFTALQTDPETTRTDRLNALLRHRDPDEIVDQARAFGRASYAATPSPLLAKTIHDLRGGGLTPLLGQLQLVRITAGAAALDTLYFLARDHLKIMRNALLGLDDAKRNEDLLPKVHGTDFIVEKWNGALLQHGPREIHLTVNCPKPAAISECCVEFGALDRILYNLINNACRHVATDSIRLVIFPVPDTDGENLRFVLLNAVTATDAETLRARNLDQLFDAGVSTTGSGFGLSVAADFVANAFGIADPAQAVAGRYLGARFVGEDFAVWFHWPIVADY